MARELAFRPDWVSPPGETLSAILRTRGLEIGDFANQMGCPLTRARELLGGGSLITPDVAARLEEVLGSPASFWIAREQQYRSDISRLNDEWLSELPLADMLGFGWVQKAATRVEQIATCLNFFGKSGVEEWKRDYRTLLNAAAFRTSPTFKSDETVIVTWLRKGEIESTKLECEDWNPARLRELLPDIRALTRKHEPSRFLSELKRLCAQCGVAVVIVRAPQGCRASGATRFLSPTKAMLALSFRYLSDDHFWFTFFHEAGHLILHGAKMVFVEGLGTNSKDEDEANRFAADILVPAEYREELASLPASTRPVIRFAQKIGTSPGVIVGQLQHMGRIAPNRLNGLKRRFTWE